MSCVLCFACGKASTKNRVNAAVNHYLLEAPLEPGAPRGVARPRPRLDGVARGVAADVLGVAHAAAVGGGLHLLRQCDLRQESTIRDDAIWGPKVYVADPIGMRTRTRISCVLLWDELFWNPTSIFLNRLLQMGVSLCGGRTHRQSTLRARCAGARDFVWGPFTGEVLVAHALQLLLPDLKLLLAGRGDDVFVPHALPAPRTFFVFVKLAADQNGSTIVRWPSATPTLLTGSSSESSSGRGELPSFVQ